MSIDNCALVFLVFPNLMLIYCSEYGKNACLKTVCFRAGCITGPNQVQITWFSHLVKFLFKKRYNLIIIKVSKLEITYIAMIG